VIDHTPIPAKSGFGVMKSSAHVTPYPGVVASSVACHDISRLQAALEEQGFVFHLFVQI
jgi:hypothetical protein